MYIGVLEILDKCTSIQ